MNQMIPSFVFRRKSWLAIKPWMQVLVVIGLLVVLPGLINQVVVLTTEADPSGYILDPAMDLLDFISQPVEENITAEEENALLIEAAARVEAYLNAMATFLQEKGAIYFGMMALELLLDPVMFAPLYGSLLDAHRKRELTLPGTLSYLRRGPKMLLLFLWMALRVWAWMLPGMGLMIAGVFVPGVGDVLLIVGLIATVVLGIRALLHYSLAPIAMMDQPELSLNGAIRASWQVMHTRKMEYFMLRISFVGWHLLVSLLSMMVVNEVMYVVCLTLTMMANMLLTLYINGAVVAFWNAYGAKKEADAEGGQEPEAGEELN